MSPIYNHSQGLKLETGQNHHFWGISCRKKLLQQKIYYDFNVSIWNVVCLCFYLFDIFLTLISLESSYFLTNYIVFNIIYAAWKQSGREQVLELRTKTEHQDWIGCIFYLQHFEYKTLLHILDPTMLLTWKFKQKILKLLNKKFRIKVIFWWNDGLFYWWITFRNILSI